MRESKVIAKGDKTEEVTLMDCPGLGACIYEVNFGRHSRGFGDGIQITWKVD
jgi:hypothetical protein